MPVCNPDFCCFAVYYYNSPAFLPAMEFYNEQLERLTAGVQWLFDTDDAARRCVYVLWSLVFDFTKQVVDGRILNTPDSEDNTLWLFKSAFINQINTKERT